MSLFSSSRCVLLLSDEGISVYEGGASGAKLIETLVWETPNLEAMLLSVIKRKAGGKSILILNDMVEQHYRKERIPKVGALDKANVIKRRVSAAFPSYPIRAGIKLKEKVVDKEGEGPSAGLYLFAAVASSDNVRKVISAVKNSYANVSGFCLLPVESAAMVQALSKKITRTAEKTAKWAVFVGQHQGGGLRQIVTKDGELALTRMTPIVESDADQEVWSSEITNEIKGTMGYLSRFGFDPSEGLDVIIIANNALAEKIASKIDFECNLNVMTAGEAANLIGVKIGRQEQLRFADPLHIAWSGRKSSMVMPLSTPQFEDISMPRNVAMVASLLLLCGCGYLAYEAYSEFSNIQRNKQDAISAQSQLVVVKQEHEEALRKKSDIGVDYVLVENSTNTYVELERTAMKPLAVIDRIGRSLGADLSIKSMEIRPAQMATSAPKMDPQTGMPIIEGPKPQDFEVVLQITLPAELEPDKGVQKINELVSRLESNLPEHRISILKQIADLSYTGNFVGESSTQQNSSEVPKEDYQAQISIKGKMI